MIISDDKMLQNSSNIIIYNGHVSISEISSFDNGEYTCIAENALGILKKVIQVIITGNVVKPNSLSTELGNYFMIFLI